MTKKEVFIKLLMLGIVIIIFSLIVLRFYNYTKIKKEDLNYQEITFDYFQEGPNSKSKNRYIIFDTNGTGYGFGSIIDVDYDKIYSIDKNTKVKVYVREVNDKYYQFEIIELYVGSKSIITIDDYHEDYTNHIKITIIIFSIFLLVLIFMILFFPKIIDKIAEKEIKKDIDFNSSYAIKKYEAFQNKIYYDQNKYIADFEECFDKPEDIHILCKVMDDNMFDGEIRLIYEKNNVEETINFFFKYNNKICFELVFQEKDGLIRIEENMIMWTYPIYKELTKNEKTYLTELLENYNKINDVKLIWIKDKNKRGF